MGTRAINRLVLSMSVPMMISMLVQALYNIVDSIFVARLSEDALAAVSLAFPVQTLMISVGVGTGVGINAFLSKSLGEHNFEKVRKTAVNGLFLVWLSAAAFMISGFFLPESYFRFQTGSETIVRYGADYLFYICVFSLGIFTQITLERLLTSTGKTFYAMISQAAGAIINIILDPVMIFGLFGFPRMETAGAAIATVTGQFCAAVIALCFNLTKNREIRLSFEGFRPDAAIIAQIYRVGLPSIVMQSIGSVMVYGFNLILLGFSSTAAAVFGVYFKLQSIFFMPVFGLNTAIVPIVAFNYGARQRGRITAAIKTGLVYALVLMFAGTGIFELFPSALLGLFDASPNMLDIGTTALRIIAIHFPPAAFCIVFMSIFQALGNGVESLVVSVARQLVVLLPAAWLLSLSGNIDLVWWSFPAAEFFSLALSSILIKRVYRKKIRSLRPGSHQAEEAAAKHAEER